VGYSIIFRKLSKVNNHPLGEVSFAQSGHPDPWRFDHPSEIFTAGRTSFYENRFHLCTRVARWLVFKPKMPIWVNFGGSCDGRCWYVLWPFGLFYSHLACLTGFFGIFYGNLVYFPRFGKLYQEKSGNPASLHSLASDWFIVCGDSHGWNIL
jgi:hypothetical protein